MSTQPIRSDASRYQPSTPEPLSATPKPEIRVLQVFNSLGVGGAETWLMALLKYFHEHSDELPVRVRFDILLTSGRQAVFDDEAAALGARLFYVPYGMKRLFPFILRWREILEEGRYHAVHDHQDYTAGIHFLLGIGCLPPVRVAHVHNPLLHVLRRNSNPTQRFAVWLGYNLLATLATHIAGTSREILSAYGFDRPAFDHVSSGTAHCGFDLTRYTESRPQQRQSVCCEFNWDANSKIILFVGRLESGSGLGANQKNPEFALQVARDCMTRAADVKMLMVGAGEAARLELTKQVESWGLGNRILLIGTRTDVPRLMVAADLLLFPSLGEGLGMVAVEAQAAGLRVLASDHVPREAAVVPGMVCFKSLDSAPTEWADTALSLMSAVPPDRTICSAALRGSGFPIEESASTLVSLYTGRGFATMPN